MAENLTPLQHYGNFWKNYFDFSGRTSRPGFWFSVLFNFLISFAIAIVFVSHTNLYFYSPDYFMHSSYFLAPRNVIGDLFSLAVFIPGIAIMHRRYHDAGKRAREFWYGVLIGFIVLIVSTLFISFAGLILTGLYWFAFTIKTIIDLCHPSVAIKSDKKTKSATKKSVVKK